MTTPADDGISAARRDMQKATETENARKAARTIALASIEKLVDQLGEVAAYLDQGEFLAALGTLQGVRRGNQKRSRSRALAQDGGAVNPPVTNGPALGRGLFLPKTRRQGDLSAILRRSVTRYP